MSSRVLLYDGNGKPVRVLATGWDAAGSGRRAKNWIPSRSSINALLSGQVDRIRARSRDETRRNPWASHASDSYVSSAIGNGIKPKPITENDDLRRQITDGWDDWVEECDADGTSDFYGLEALAVRAYREGGDVFCRYRPRRPSDGLSVPLQIQLLEAEMCDATKTQILSGGRTIKAGIEFDAVGRRMAYHMFRNHPGDFGMTSGQLVPVPASEIAHVFHVLRPGQVRGIPGLASVLARLHEINEFDDAKVLRAKIQNLYATFETVPAEDDSVLDGASPSTDDDSAELIDVRPGSHVPLPPGHDIKFADPPSDGGEYEAFMRTQLRAIAAGAGITYEQLTHDLTGVNFSSIRAGLIEFRRQMEQIQNHVIVFQFCRPIFRRWMETAILSGRIVVPRNERQNIRQLMRAEWTPTPGWEYVDPDKEVRAQVRAIRAGLTSRTKVVSKYGSDVEQLDKQIRAENRRADQMELVFDSDPRRVSAAGGSQDPSPVPGTENDLPEPAEGAA